MIEINNLTAGYGKKISLQNAESAEEKNKSRSSLYGIQILNGLSCTMPQNKVTVLAGPNGSGKSTLIKTICGFLSPWDGKILIDGKQLEEYSLTERAQTIAYVPQSRVIPDIVVERLVLHGRFPYAGFPHRYTKLDHDIAETVMKKMHIENIADRNLQTLSGGQRQKVYLAMALAQDTPVLMLDEPLTFLDIRQQLELVDTVKKLASDGKTVCMVVHDLNMAISTADHLIVLKNGIVASEGEPFVAVQSGVIDDVFGVKTEKLSSSSGTVRYAFTL